MAVSTAQLAFAEELFGPLRVSSRRMFGAVGLYAEGVMFALIDDEVIYLKADEVLKADLAAAGSSPWVYTYPSGPRAGQAMEMGYYAVPESALDDPEAACAWGRRALNVALAAEAGKRGRKAR